MKQKDKQSLESVKRTKDVSPHNVFLLKEKQSRDPSESEQDDEDGGTFDPRGHSDIAALMLLGLGALMNAALVIL